MTALQLLPPRQRAVLILRDVLDFSAREVAGLLEVTEQSVTSALRRARATLARELPSPARPAPPPGSPAEQALLSRLIRAFENADVDALVALLSDDVWVRMPPVPLEYQGQELARHFFATVAFRQGRRYRLIPARANGQPAFGGYLRDPFSHVAHASGLFVVTLAGDRISVITRFDNNRLPPLWPPPHPSRRLSRSAAAGAQQALWWAERGLSIYGNDCGRPTLSKNCANALRTTARS